ncbi:hypothetical protein IWW38_002916 [Coemansia aciculifera]|uniref:Uncharacterized protein n=1 Tax=Coemansia aciculifera TaxID=417176 RepID=A0ACC1M2L3_9FUNG|nr:hypothetical protein IWW38_002916 [Coemansia aciculifera]
MSQHMYVPISPLEQRREQSQAKSARGVVAPLSNTWALREEDEDEHVRRNGARATSVLGGSVVGGRLGLRNGLAPRVPRRSMSYSAHSHREAVELSIQEAGPRRANPAQLKPQVSQHSQVSNPLPAAQSLHLPESCDTSNSGDEDVGRDMTSDDGHVALPELAVDNSGSASSIVVEAETEPVGQAPETHWPLLKVPDDSKTDADHWRHELALVANNLVEWLDAMESEIVALEQTQA